MKKSKLSKAKSTFCDTNEPLTEFQLQVMKQDLARCFKQVQKILLIDPLCPNSSGTPDRLAKMYVDELFAGRYQPRPSLVSFPFEQSVPGETYLCMHGPIAVRSMCAHHWLPVTGTCSFRLVEPNLAPGLSKFTKIIQWISARPTIQESLVKEIGRELQLMTGSRSVQVILSCTHMCMCQRGVKGSSTFDTLFTLGPDTDVKQLSDYHYKV